MTPPSVAHTHELSERTSCLHLQDRSTLKIEEASPYKTVAPRYQMTKHHIPEHINKTFITNRTSTASAHSCLFYVQKDNRSFCTLLLVLR